MATGASANVDKFSGRGVRFPIQKFRDGTVTPHVNMSTYGTASAADPGGGTKAANHTAFTTAVNAAKAAGLPLLIDGQFWDDSALAILGNTSGKALQIQGRTPQLDSTYTAARMDGRVGNDGLTGANPASGLVLGESTSNPTLTHKIELYGFRNEIVGATVRGGSGGGKYNIWAAHVDDGVFHDLAIHGGAQAALVYSRLTQRSLTRGCSVAHVFADGLSYQVGVGNDHLNEHNEVSDVGDDFIPVVQGETAASPLTAVTIRYNRCRLQQVTGASVKVVGGRNIFIHHNSFENGAGQGIRGGRDATTGTYGAYDILIQDNLFAQPSFASGVASAVRLVGYPGTGTDGSLLGTDTTFVVDRNVFNQYDYRLIFLGQDADAAPYTGLTLTNNKLQSREDAVDVNSAIYAASTNGLVCSGNTYTHIGQLLIFCSSTNQISNGTMVFLNESVDWNWANQATNDLFNFGSALSAAKDYTIRIGGITSTSPNACDRWIASGGVQPANVWYTMSTCTSAPDANDKTLHGGTNGVNGWVID